MALMSSPEGRRILLLTPFTPRLDGDHGGSRALGHLVDVLVGRHRISVLSLRRPGEPPMTSSLVARCERVEEIPLQRSGPITHAAWEHGRYLLAALRGTPPWVLSLRSRSYAARVAQLTRAVHFDVVQLHFEVMAQYLRVLDGTPAARVLVVDEPDTIAAAGRYEAARGARRLVRRLQLRAWRRLERDAVAGADAVVALTERDRRILSDTGASTPVCTIPLTTPLPAHPLNPRGEGPPTVLFVGNYMHTPNVAAAVTLLTDILPAVRTKRPDLRATIVGPNPPEALFRLADEMTTVTGSVPDVTPYLDRASVVVAPIWTGGGMRVKVLETLAAGKALVASPRAIEGLSVRDGEHLLVADTPAAFSGAVVELLDDERRREALATQARSWATANLGPQPTLERYERLWDFVERRGAARTATEASAAPA